MQGWLDPGNLLIVGLIAGSLFTFVVLAAWGARSPRSKIRMKQIKILLEKIESKIIDWKIEHLEYLKGVELDEIERIFGNLGKVKEQLDRLVMSERYLSSKKKYPDRLLTAKEAAEYLGIPLVELLQKAREGKIFCYKQRGGWKFKRSILDRWKKKTEKAKKEETKVLTQA
ncbi:MAG: helix-turn-helix domain-containing protein [bacterium]